MARSYGSEFIIRWKAEGEIVVDAHNGDEAEEKALNILFELLESHCNDVDVSIDYIERGEDSIDWAAS